MRLLGDALTTNVRLILFRPALVKDTVSAETIAKSPDKDAASVVKRVPAVTIKEGKFVFVRGLGERYSSALLDGSRLPSTDPSKRVVPLDLFPAEFLESLGKFKFGPAYAYRTRAFDQRRFDYGVNGAALDLGAPPETILAPSNLVPGVVNVSETTQNGDRWSVSHEIMGAYGMFDLPLVRDRLRLIAGVREEYSNIVLETGRSRPQPRRSSRGTSTRCPAPISSTARATT